MGKTSVNASSSEKKQHKSLEAAATAAAAALGKHVVSHPVGWLPVTTAASGLLAAGAMNAADHFYGPVGACAAAAIATGGWLIAEELIDWTGVRRFWPATGMVAAAGATAVALYGPIADLLPWGTGDVIAASLTAATGLGIAWWHGLACKEKTPVDLAREGLRWALDELGISSQTTISPTQVNEKTGDLEWIVTLGHDDQGKLDRSKLSWKLDVEPARVLIRAAKGDSPRKFRIVQFKKSPGSLKSQPHPATIKANTAPGGTWAPGARTVAMGAPLGPAAGLGEVAIVSIYEPGYGAYHNLFTGQTGAGKSTLLGSVIAHVSASTDAINVGFDLGKAGETFDDWDEAGAMAYVLCSTGEESDLLEAARQFLVDLQWLNTQTRLRGFLMKTRKVLDANGEKCRVWPASPEHPVIACHIEEYATSIANIRALDSALADAIEAEIESLGRGARYAGISINLVTQRPTEDELPTSIRGQLNQTIAGKMKAGSDAGRLASKDVDLVNDLKAGRGLCYVDAEAYERPLMVKGYDLSKPKTCYQIASLYTDTQPHFAWGATSNEDETMTDTDLPDEEDLFDFDASADGSELAGVSLAAPATAPVTPLTSDDASEAGKLAAAKKAILAALEAAPAEGLKRADVEALTKVSSSTANRALNELQAEGLIVKVGRSSATRYQAAPPADGVLAAVA
ncbi:hypothetical protein ADL26_07925 [Thermoactinomyces vulgaris]|nr:hypothetical protein ADL26_07925 [Thermoactinomyces vulgaris]